VILVNLIANQNLLGACPSAVDIAIANRIASREPPNRKWDIVAEAFSDRQKTGEEQVAHPAEATRLSWPAEDPGSSATKPDPADRSLQNFYPYKCCFANKKIIVLFARRARDSAKTSKARPAKAGNVDITAMITPQDE
jgi:hypothetical protein